MRFLWWFIGLSICCFSCTKHPAEPAAVITKRSTVFVADDSTLYALDAVTGLKRWETKTGASNTVSVPAVDTGMVFVSYNDSNLYAFDAKTGVKKWVFRAGGRIDASPTIANGIVYVGSSDLNIYALDAFTGAKKWQYYTYCEKILSGPVVTVSNGVLYFGTPLCGVGIDHLMARDAQTGAKIWSVAFTYNSGVITKPKVADGILFVSPQRGAFYALDAQTGKQKWAFSPERSDGGYDLSVPAIGQNMVYVSKYRSLYALDETTGEQKWQFTVKENYYARSPSFSAGVVYVHDGMALYALDAITGTVKWTTTIDGSFLSNPAVANGFVYVSGTDKNFYAFDAATGEKKWTFKTSGLVYPSPTVLDATGKVHGVYAD